jgi:hypothetical protein
MKSSNSANPLLAARINRLRDAVQAAHHCMAAHVQSVPVIEKPGDQPLWQGVVEVFNLFGHPQAKRCYAWFADKDEGPTTMVLEIPPVDSPRAAVKSVFERGTPPPPAPATPPAPPAT